MFEELGGLGIVEIAKSSPFVRELKKFMDVHWFPIGCISEEGDNYLVHIAQWLDDEIVN